MTRYHIVHIYTDGSPSAENGKPATAFIASRNNRKVHFEAHFLDVPATVNDAEYGAIILALQWAVRYLERHPAATFVVFSDSQLIVRQINGEYECREPRLAELLNRALSLIAQLEIEFRWIPREQNTEVDQLIRTLANEQAKV